MPLTALTALTGPWARLAAPPRPPPWRPAAAAGPARGPPACWRRCLRERHRVMCSGWDTNPQPLGGIPSALRFKLPGCFWRRGLREQHRVRDGGAEWLASGGPGSMAALLALERQRHAAAVHKVTPECSSASTHDHIMTISCHGYPSQRCPPSSASATVRQAAARSWYTSSTPGRCSAAISAASTPSPPAERSAS
jgi:hypothetical protein